MSLERKKSTTKSEISRKKRPRPWLSSRGDARNERNSRKRKKRKGTGLKIIEIFLEKQICYLGQLSNRYFRFSSGVSPVMIYIMIRNNPIFQTYFRNSSKTANARRKAKRVCFAKDRNSGESSQTFRKVQKQRIQDETKE